MRRAWKVMKNGKKKDSSEDEDEVVDKTGDKMRKDKTVEEYKDSEEQDTNHEECPNR